MSMLPRKFYLDNIFDNFMDGSSFDTMKCDIYEKEGIYHIEADIPGLDKKDISIECNNGYITIKATKEKEEQTEEKTSFVKKDFMVLWNVNSMLAMLMKKTSKLNLKMEY